VRSLPLRLVFCAALFASAGPISAYPLIYAEDYYELYHRHLYQATDDLAENLIWLEKALSSDFRNPLYALAQIETTEQWARYRELFRMHVNLEIVKLYRTIGSKYQKQHAYFYNFPWKRQNLESLDTAESYYRQGYYYWSQALEHSLEAWSLRREHLPEIQAWQTENYRIVEGDLDYRKILDADLRKIAKVRAEFLAMGAGTY
jgi:hypothetical protein